MLVKKIHQNSFIYANCQLFKKGGEFLMSVKYRHIGNASYNLISHANKRTAVSIQSQRRACSNERAAASMRLRPQSCFLADCCDVDRPPRGMFL